MREHWMAAFSYIDACRCWESLKTGSCGCRTKRGKHKDTNPCVRVQELCEDILSLSIGETPQFGNGVQQVFDAIESHTCHAYRSHGCNHQKCNRATDILNWLQQLLRKNVA